MRPCERCGGSGYVKKGFWRFAKSVFCDGCGGSGKQMDLIDRQKKVEIDGDPVRMQETFHIMAKARHLADERAKKGKRRFDVDHSLKNAQNHLREKDYDEALLCAKKALEHAEKM